MLQTSCTLNPRSAVIPRYVPFASIICAPSLFISFTPHAKVSGLVSPRSLGELAIMSGGLRKER